MEELSFTEVSVVSLINFENLHEIEINCSLPVFIKNVLCVFQINKTESGTDKTSDLCREAINSLREKGRYGHRKCCKTRVRIFTERIQEVYRDIPELMTSRDDSV